ncbi:MAG: hypothetical protein JST16_19045 [Bdellovibrionales bacterium]|nr:hypothetical protein [Bdellovibrionales bacterium]
MKKLEDISRYIRFAESRDLLDAFLKAAEQQKFKSVALVSEASAEGKTLITLTLALGLAELHQKRVLIVDTSSMTRENSLSLLQALELDEKESLQPGKPLPTFNLKVDYVRPASLEAPEIDRILNAYRDNYDFVLLDTMAMNSRNRNNLGALTVAFRSERTLVVAGPSQASGSNARKLAERVTQSGVRLLGLVCNGEFK